MTLEELIEQTEKVAIYHDKDKMPEDTWHYTNELMKERYYQLTACLKELKAHREAWEKILDEMMNVLIPGQDAEYVYENIYDIIRKYRPKEGDINANKE